MTVVGPLRSHSRSSPFAVLELSVVRRQGTWARWFGPWPKRSTRVDRTPSANQAVRGQLRVGISGRCGALSTGPGKAALVGDPGDQLLDAVLERVARFKAK